eukprot:NODE_385_length_1713_cov_29.978365_g305_i0.p1 GENE.NODE_385_length_1713_cov_29.978365_g305_i0~~NODE_385_length_1713_cov_29.978365_g305_i0.p1  ORF type:complete len:295 (+),score=47.34 NODE_385_length_1713_cov_29.978365_g305_i0:194-1078(+)
MMVHPEQGSDHNHGGGRLQAVAVNVEQTANLKFSATCNPYVAIAIGDSDSDNKVCTRVAKGTTNPKWNEVHSLAIPAPLTPREVPLLIKVFDHHDTAAHELLAMGRVVLTNLQSQVAQTVEVKLESTASNTVSTSSSTAATTTRITLTITPSTHPKGYDVLEIRIAAAINIQRCWRSYQTRRNFHLLDRLHEQQEGDRSIVVEEAVQTIQCAWRVAIARTRMAALRIRTYTAHQFYAQEANARGMLEEAAMAAFASLLKASEDRPEAQPSKPWPKKTHSFAPQLLHAKCSRLGL